jgi:DNA-directed RNA polymerase subunit RPC12/RpoP
MIDRALNKTKSIDVWIERDKKRDRFFNSINEPKIKCNKCSSLMIMKDKMLKI